MHLAIAIWSFATSTTNCAAVHHKPMRDLFRQWRPNLASITRSDRLTSAPLPRDRNYQSKLLHAPLASHFLLMSLAEGVAARFFSAITPMTLSKLRSSIFFAGQVQAALPRCG
jgi:hypothetical protein